MRKVLTTICLVCLIAFVASTAAAKDLTNRIGVGYNNQLNFNFLGGQDASVTDAFIASQSISAKYWFTENLGIEPMVGYYTAKNKEIGGWAAEIAAKVLYNLNKEENMNFYGGGGLGILPMKIDYGPHTQSDTGFEAMAFLGVEFFFSGLPNLGFDVEFGLKYIDVSTFAQLSTYGGGFGVLGIRYYF